MSGPLAFFREIFSLLEKRELTGSEDLVDFLTEKGEEIPFETVFKKIYGPKVYVKWAGRVLTVIIEKGSVKKEYKFYSITNALVINVCDENAVATSRGGDYLSGSQLYNVLNCPAGLLEAILLKAEI